MMTQTLSHRWRAVVVALVLIAPPTGSAAADTPIDLDAIAEALRARTPPPEAELPTDSDASPVGPTVADEAGKPAWRFPASPHELAAYVASLSEPRESADAVRKRICALVLSLGGAAAAEATSAGCKPPPDRGG